MLYLTDVPGRRKEQAVFKTTLKAPHSYIVTTSEPVNAGALPFEMPAARSCLEVNRS